MDAFYSFAAYLYEFYNPSSNQITAILPAIHPDEQLLIAASNSNISGVQAALASGANVEARDEFGNTALMLGALNGRRAIVGILLAAGADIHAENNDKDTGLMFAANQNDIQTVQILLNHTIKPMIDAQNYREETALALAIEKGRIAIVKLLLDAGAKVNRDDLNEMLIDAVSEKILKKLQAVLFVADYSDTTGLNLNYALEHSVHSGCLEMAQRLVCSGADFNQFQVGENCLRVAAKKGQVNKARTLVALGFPLENASPYGDTALIWAIRRNHKVIIKELVDAGACLSVINAQNETPFSLVLTNPYPDQNLTCKMFYKMTAQEVTMFEQMPTCALAVQHLKTNILLKIKNNMLVLVGLMLPTNPNSGSFAYLPHELKSIIFLMQCDIPNWYRPRFEADLLGILDSIQCIEEERKIPVAVAPAIVRPLVFSFASQNDEINSAITDQKSAPTKKERCVLL